MDLQLVSRKDAIIQYQQNAMSRLNFLTYNFYYKKKRNKQFKNLSFTGKIFDIISTILAFESTWCRARSGNAMAASVGMSATLQKLGLG
jgi:hypothetical protein